jgi:hypothetical protein
VRILHPIFQREITQLSSTHVITMAFELVILGAPAPFRLVNFDQPISFHGLFFEPFPVSVETLEEATSAALVSLRVTAQNVSQEMQSLLENYWGSTIDPQWTATIWQLDAMAPDTVPLSAGEVLSVSSVVTDLVTASFELIAEGLTLGRSVPRRRYTTSNGFKFLPRR